MRIILFTGKGGVGKITANLFGQEINALEEIEKNRGDIKSY